MSEQKRNSTPTALSANQHPPIGRRADLVRRVVASKRDERRNRRPTIRPGVARIRPVTATTGHNNLTGHDNHTGHDSLTGHNHFLAASPTPACAQARPLTRTQWLRLALCGVVIVLVALAAGFGVWFVVPTTYAARAQVLYLLSQYEPTGDSLREDRTLTTQASLVTSHTVLGSVSTVAGVPELELGKKVTASVVSGTAIVQIEVVDRDPDAGVRLLNAVVQTYLRLEQLNAGPPTRMVVAPYALTVPVSPSQLYTTAAGGLSGLLVAAAVVGVIARRMTRR